MRRFGIIGGQSGDIKRASDHLLAIQSYIEADMLWRRRGKIAVPLGDQAPDRGEGDNSPTSEERRDQQAAVDAHPVRRKGEGERRRRAHDQPYGRDAPLQRSVPVGAKERERQGAPTML